MRQEKKQTSNQWIKIVGIVCFFLSIFLGMFLVGAAVYMILNWAHVSLLEVITQIKTLDGTSFTSLMYFLLSAVFVPAFLVSIAVFFYVLFRKRKKAQAIVFRTTYIVTLVVALSISIYTWHFLDVSTYLHLSAQATTLLEDHYVDPWDDELESRISFPEEKKNLVLLYLESTEVTFADKEHGGFFEESVIPNLTNLAIEGEDFSGEGSFINGSTPLPFTDWTAAAMFSTLSGLPYKIGLTEDALGEKADFFPGITSLGDVLENEGYDQTFYCGSNASFGGRRLNLSAHGDFSFRDFNYYNSLPEEDPNHVEYDDWWGYEDIHLFSFLKEGMLEKAKEYEEDGSPFHLMALTVDSHFGDVFTGDGHVYPEGEYDPSLDQYSKAISYDDSLIGEFVSWFFENEEISQKTKDNTVFVFLGDHPTMSKSYCLEAEEAGYQRKNFVSYLNAKPAKEYPHRKREYSPFDAFPTILGALGCSIEGDHLGLGSNLFSAEPTLLEIYGEAYLKEEIQKNEPLMSSLLIPNTDYQYLEKTKRLPFGEVGFLKEEDGSFSFFIKNIGNDPERFESGIVTLDDGSVLQEMELKKTTIDGEEAYWGRLDLLEDGEYEASFFLLGESGNFYEIGKTNIEIS